MLGHRKDTLKNLNMYQGYWYLQFANLYNTVDKVLNSRISKFPLKFQLGTSLVGSE